MITLLQLKQIVPLTKTAVLEPFIEPLNAAMDEWEINNPQRQAAFLAQVAHESGGFHYVRELASGAEYDTGEKAIRLGNTPEDDGDGEKYRGRGLLQITGLANYLACGAALGLDLRNSPELLEIPENAARCPGWFWWSRKLNALADAGNMRRITLAINGGLNGFAERLKYWEAAKEAIA